MPTASQNGTRSTAMLHALAERAAPDGVDSIADSAAEELIRSGPGRERIHAWHRLFQPGTTIGRQLWEDDAFRTLAFELAEAFVLFVEVAPAEIGRRQIVKLAFDASKSGPKAGTWREAIGWDAVSDSFSVPQAGMAQSVHFELEAPEEMTVTGGVLLADRGGQTVHDELLAAASRAHFNVSGIDRAGGDVYVLLRPRGGRLLAPLAVVAAVNAGALGFAFWQAKAFSGDSSDAVTAALVVVPGVLLSAIVRSDEHEVLGTFLVGARLVAALAALSSFAAALVLAAGFSLDTRRIALGVATGVAAVCALVLLRSWWAQR